MSQAARKLKKSESLEIRIPHPTKEAFMARCRDEGVSASEALRGFIDSRLAGPERSRAPRKGLRLAAGALIALAVGAVAAPTLARTTAQGEFERMDANGDRRVTPAEFAAGSDVEVAGLRIAAAAADEAAARAVLMAAAFRRLDRDHDGAVSLAEYRDR